MAKRKQTPDVLAQILGGENLIPTPGEPTEPVGRMSMEAIVPERWKYRVITFQDYHGWRPRYVDGMEVRDWTNGPLIHEYLKVLGEDGWELAAASAGERMYGNADNHQLYFKKLK